MRACACGKPLKWPRTMCGKCAKLCDERLYERIAVRRALTAWVGAGDLPHKKAKSQ